jgi:hypothetical protein
VWFVMTVDTGRSPVRFTEIETTSDNRQLVSSCQESWSSSPGVAFGPTVRFRP